MNALMPHVLALLGLLAGWTALAWGNATIELVNPALLPTPADVLRVAGESMRTGELWRHILISLLRVFEGFGIAALAAVTLGILTGLCVPLRLMVEPIIELARPIPPLAFLPLFLAWFGLGETSKVFFIAYTTFFPMFIAVAASVLQVDRMLLRAAASLGASRTDLVWRVVLPASLPGIIVALRLGFGLGLFVIVAAEFIGADAGLGHFIMEGRTFFNPAQIVLGALMLGLLGSLINALLSAVERRFLQWRAAV